jgi:hypothetical protein
MAWPAWSLDITPMDFFLCGHIEALIYMSPVDSEEDLIACIFKAAANIRQQSGIFECTRQSLLHCCLLCVKVGDHTSEHKL